MAKKKRRSPAYGRRGFRCTWCGKVRLLSRYGQLEQISSHKTHKMQCQNCGHFHWELCTTSKMHDEMAVRKETKDAARRGSDGSRYL